MTYPNDTIRPIVWQDDQLHLLDQRKLPQEQSMMVIESSADVVKAIKDMVVRGAPAIGIAAAYGVVLAARKNYAQNPQSWQLLIETDMQQLLHARPTAVNLMWALRRMRSCFATITGDPAPLLLAEAQRLHQEDIDANYRMGELGASLLPKFCRVLTHCNAGALATGGYGTALGVIRSAFTAGKIMQVYAAETRPWLQGARLTAWELRQDKIPVTVIVDGAAAALMREKLAQWVIVGADRIAANGDFANKIGTYNLAVLARQHGVKFMVVAPTSTLDMSLTDGSKIVIEERAAEEVLTFAGQQIAPHGVSAWNPSFDVTPAELVDFLITEKSILEKPTTAGLLALMK
jgi:methylthioribose-1-phosphate isomerase